VILDSSAVISVLREEDGHELLHPLLEMASTISIGAPTLFETEMVAVKWFGENGRTAVERFLRTWEVEVVPFGERHGQAALAAFVRYGKGRHPAALNYGDCMTYATAHIAQMPLLFVGNDFAQTDIAPA
jgi:ribonuclease VapC